MATVVRRVDADTLRLRIDQGLDSEMRLTIRLAGIDAPEMSTDAGREAAEWVDAWLAEHSRNGRILLHTIKDRREKYGRYLGLVFDPMYPEHALVEEMVAAGHAERRAYSTPMGRTLDIQEALGAGHQSFPVTEPAPDPLTEPAPETVPRTDPVVPPPSRSPEERA